jgi:D-alanine-D-alanine ligase
LHIHAAFLIVLRDIYSVWSSMRIGFAYNQRPTGSASKPDVVGPLGLPLTPDAYVEWDEPETIDAVAEALSAFGDVVRLEAVGDFAGRLRRARVDFLFNMAEGVHGPNRESHVPAIAEFLGIPYTASDPLTLALALHKGRAKEIWSHRGLPTAPFIIVESEADLPALKRSRRYPMFLKPAWEGSSKGISQENYCRTPAQAVARARYLLETYREPVLAETYLPGEEFTAAILGNGDTAGCLPLIRYRFEVLPDGALPIMGYEAKWVWDQPEEPLDILECPAEVPEQLEEALRQTALAAYRALGCRDWARVDLRLDGTGVPNLVEINPLPGVIPDPAANSCFPKAASAAGLSHAELIQTVVGIAWRRLTGEELAAPTLAGVAD